MPQPPPLPIPQTPQEALSHFQSHLTHLLYENFIPFIYPLHALPPTLLVLYHLLPPSRSPLIYYVRYPLFIAIVWLSVSSMMQCRSAMVTVGYGIGLLNAWCVLWGATLLVWRDFRGEAGRVEVQGEMGGKQLDDLADGEGTGMEQSEDRGIRSRIVDSDGKRTGKDDDGEQSTTTDVKIVYQSLPTDFLHRLDWVLDLVTNFRGTRWNHQIHGLPPPPSDIQAGLADHSFPAPTSQSHLTRADLLCRDLPTFLLCCVALDVLKTLTMQDPYFWGLGPSSSSPFRYPMATRLVLSLLFVYTSLQTIFVLAPLIFGVLLGPRCIGQHAWPWLYHPCFGPLSQVWQKGIAGFWAGWWHQLFRFAFEQAGEFAGRVVRWEKRSRRGKVLRVLVAFACSGALHACASYATLGDTKPMRGSFAFFMVQPVGILAQSALSGWMRQRGLREKVPVWLRELGNMVFVVAWGYLTGSLVSDDFAATGIWLYEPLPISPLRGLRREGWWRWSGSWVRWHTGERWWESGLAF